MNDEAKIWQARAWKALADLGLACDLVMALSSIAERAIGAGVVKRGDADLSKCMTLREELDRRIVAMDTEAQAMALAHGRGGNA